MNIFAQLFVEFLKIGTFAVGGGMATIPFLYRLSRETGWYTTSFISDMVAISESTPGPIGINMATYVGYSVAGIAGGVIATLGIVVPAIVIASIVAISLDKSRKSEFSERIFLGLRPAVTGLIAAAGMSIVEISMMDMDALANGALFSVFRWERVAYGALIFICIRKFKKHPIMYIAISALVGIAAGALSDACGI